MYRCHYPFRRIFECSKAEHDQLSDRAILSISIKALNDTMGPNGLLTSLIVFEKLPKFSCQSNTNPIQAKRFKVLNLVKMEMETVVG